MDDLAPFPDNQSQQTLWCWPDSGSQKYFENFSFLSFVSYKPMDAVIHPRLEGKLLKDPEQIQGVGSINVFLQRPRDGVSEHPL